MEIPRPHPRSQGSLPPIYIDDDGPTRSRSSPFAPAPSSSSSPFSPAYASIPMSIPHAAADEFRAPPPLPPPRVVPVPGPMSAAAEDYRRRELQRPPPPLLDDMPNYKMRLDRDEGYYSMESRSRDSFPSAAGPYQFRPSSDAYDNSLLSKLDIRGTLDNRSPPRHGLSASAHDLRPAISIDRFAALQPLSLPTRMKQSQLHQHAHQQPALLESPGRYTDTPLHSAVSPRSTPFGLGGGDYRSPKEATTPSDYSATPYYDRSPSVRTRRTDSGSLHANDDDDTAGSFAMDETSRLRDLRLGQKRRASSPPGGDCGAARGAAAPRLRAVSPQDALSPSSAVSSAATAGRPCSYGSAHSPAATSATSASSTCGGTTTSSTTTASACTSPYMACAPSAPLALLPRVPTLPTGPAGPRAPHRASDAGKPGGLLKRSDFFMCDCCPKKPKKFESEEQLRAHEMEKQYECLYCGNRFKNKNEAERHQNSLHVRRHSWSCAALSGYDRAFHESTFRPGEVDMCGYCGEEFARSGRADESAVLHATEQDWDERIRHLQDVHKFRECNASKKFFRADHFRQHLKHSHAGTSGKWTNMLENACMIEEEPPLPMR